MTYVKFSKAWGSESNEDNEKNSIWGYLCQ